MVHCPACKTAIDERASAAGVCPRCGQPLRPSGTTPLAGPLTTPDATLDFQAAPRTTRDPLAQTLDVPPSVPAGDKFRTMTIAPRKLSVGNIKMITQDWGAAAGSDASPRSSLKFDSKASTGMGSSLVVNQRAVRSFKETPQAPAGADYELLEVIGKGGMGVVYSAREASVDRLVAVKMIRPNAAADAERREKFLSEAVVTGDLDHPNIVPIYELGTNENDALFYSMKRVQGTPWSHVIGQKSLAENLEILMKVSDAIAFAHANGVIHRDLKPENVMLGDFGEVLVMDWGLALATAGFRHAEFVTTDDSMGGTPAYMAPEMVTGPFDLIGPASDIYLLGALLFEVVTGLRPHHGTTAQECLFAAATNSIQPCEQTGELIDIAYHAMATEPADRPGSVQEFQSAIRDYQSHCESAALSTRADHELAQALKSGDYQSFAHALFGFQEAAALWDGNGRARLGASEAKLAYAARAKQKGDYELGLSLLDADDEAHAGLRVQLGAALRERSARQKWLTRFKQIAAALVVIVFGVITVALVVVMEAKDREAAAKDQAIKDKILAVQAKQEADLAREEEKKQKEKAVAAELKAKNEEALARRAEAAAQVARDDEKKQKEKAIEAENKARIEEQNAVRARQGEEYAAYVARIGMAAAKLEENAFDAAESLLAACLPKPDASNLRNWEWGYLDRLRRQGVNFKSHGTVNAVAFFPDGRSFAAAGDDGKAHVWNVAGGAERLAIDHGSYVHAVAISPDGQRVATAGGDSRVRISSAKDGKLLRTLEGHADRVLGAAFSPRDGRWLLTCSRDKTARVWDTSTGKEIPGSPLRGHTWWVWSAVFSPDEKQIVTGGQDGKAIVWTLDLGGAEPIAQHRVFLGHEGPVFAAAFSPNGRYVVSAGYDKRVIVWEPEKIQNVDLKQLVANEPVAPQESRAFEGHSAPVRAVGFSFDGQCVLSGGDDNTVRIWDAMTGRPRSVLRGHSRPVESCVFSPGGRQVLSGDQAGQIKLWNILDYKEVRAPQGLVLRGHDDAILSAAFSRDGRRIVTASRDHTARVFDATSGESVSWLKEGHEFLASRAIYFHRGRWLLTASGDDTVRIWDALTGSQLSSIEGTGRTAAVAVSRDSKRILTGRPETKQDNPAQNKTAQNNAPAANARESGSGVALWDLDAEGKSPRTHLFANEQFGRGHRGTVTAVAISPDGRRLFSGDDVGVGKLWEASTGTESATLKGHTAGITAACFLPDGRRLLTSSSDGTVAQWNVATGEELPLMISHADPERRQGYDAQIREIALSPDGRQLLTLSEGSQGVARQSVIAMWSVDTSKLIRELYRGPDNVTSIAFADAGRAALAASSQRATDADSAASGRSVVRRWDLDTGRETTAPGGGAFLDFKRSAEAIWAAIEAPDGAEVLTVGGKGAVLWDPSNLAKPELVFKPHSGVTSASFSADGRTIVTGSSDHRAKIWNVETGQGELQLPEEHTRPITSAMFSPVDPRVLLTASNDGTARIWDLPARRVVRVLRHQPAGAGAKPIRCAIFSPDGKDVLTAGEDGTLRVWNAASGQPAGSIMKLDAPVFAAAYSADGRWIMAGDANGQAIVFDALTRKPLVRYSGHTDAINSVALSPDGRRALTGSSDRSAKIWDVVAQDARPAEDAQPRAAADSASPQEGIEILTLKHHDQPVTSVAFSPDGRSILTAGLDGTAVLWLTDDWTAPAKVEAP